MSSRDYYKNNRETLPPIRDVLGDELDRPSRNRSSTYSFDGFHHALPSTTSSRDTLQPTKGPTLPPIRRTHDNHASERFTTRYAHTPHNSTDSSSHSRSSTIATSSQAYSFDVFRPTPAGLVHASSSSQSQGILKPSRAYESAKKINSLVGGDHDDDDISASTKKYVCSICRKRFGRPSSLKTHEVVHSDEKPYECTYPGCGKAFTVPSNVRRHYRKVHEGGHSGSGDEAEEHIRNNASSSRYSSARPSTPTGYYSSTRH